MNYNVVATDNGKNIYLYLAKEQTFNQSVAMLCTVRLQEPGLSRHIKRLN